MERDQSGCWGARQKEIWVRDEIMVAYLELWGGGERWRNVDIFEICLEDKTNGTFGHENATVAEWMQ